VKLLEWAQANGVSRQSATRWFHDRVLPVPARQLAVGMILVDEPARSGGGVAIYGRLSSSDQRSDIDRQVARLAEYLTASGSAPTKILSEVGSERAPHTPARALRDASVGTIVVEHRDRFARFGVEYLEATLAAQGRKLIVVEQAEVSEDVVRDMVEVLTSFCARLSGRRSAKHQAEQALATASTNKAA
jgi:putative resolvase